MTGYQIATILRGQDGELLRDPETGQLELSRRAAGNDLESAKRAAKQYAYAQRTGAYLEDGTGRQLVWYLWVPSQQSVEEVAPGTGAEEAVSHARKRLAEARRPAVRTNDRYDEWYRSGGARQAREARGRANGARGKEAQSAQRGKAAHSAQHTAHSSDGNGTGPAPRPSCALCALSCLFPRCVLPCSFSLEAAAAVLCPCISLAKQE